MVYNPFIIVVTWYSKQNQYTKVNQPNRSFVYNHCVMITTHVISEEMVDLIKQPVINHGQLSDK